MTIEKAVLTLIAFEAGRALDNLDNLELVKHLLEGIRDFAANPPAEKDTPAVYE